MVTDEELLNQLDRLPAKRFSGEVFRHTLGERRPEAANLRGGRWNGPGVSAIYASLERATAIAEGSRVLSLQHPRLRLPRFVHRLHIIFDRVVDLQPPDVRGALELDPGSLTADEMWACRRIGDAACALHRQGLLVPSARADGTNLVIYPARWQPRPPSFEVLETVRIPPCR